jgi:hypothetical protein
MNVDTKRKALCKFCIPQSKYFLYLLFVASYSLADTEEINNIHYRDGQAGAYVYS